MIFVHHLFVGEKHAFIHLRYRLAGILQYISTQQAVWGLLVGWIVWLAVVSVCIFTLTPPVVPEVIVGTSMVPLLTFVCLSIHYQRV